MVVAVEGASDDDELPGVGLEGHLVAASGQPGDAGARSAHHALLPVAVAVVADTPQIPGVGLEGDLEATCPAAG